MGKTVDVASLLYTVETWPYTEVKPNNETLFSMGWGSEDPNFEVVLHQTKPHLVVEVGSWLGASACHMASILQQMNLTPHDWEIVCVDTWLGSSEMWKDKSDQTRYGQLNLVKGYPSIYYQFIQNIVNSGWRSHITPCPMPSLQAARFLKSYDVHPDVVYLDASHDYEDVLADLRAWYPLTKDVIFGDDLYTFMDVHKALEQFCNETGITYREVGGRQWVITKSQSY